MVDLLKQYVMKIFGNAIIINSDSAIKCLRTNICACIYILSSLNLGFESLENP